MAAPSFGYPTPPAYRYVLSGFWDSRSWGLHAADDFPCPIGTPVSAALGGRVTGAGWYGNGGWSIEIEHAGGMYRSRYMHLSQILVSVGQTVSTGELIAYSGNSTNIAGGVGPHLHFAIWVKSYEEALTIQNNPYYNYSWWAVDPQLLLTTAGGDWFDMATEAQLRQIVHDEIGVWVRSPEFAVIVRQARTEDIWHALFDLIPRPGGTERRLDAITRIPAMQTLVNDNHAILFDDCSNDSPADKRRLIKIKTLLADLFSRP